MDFVAFSHKQTSDKMGVCEDSVICEYCGQELGNTSCTYYTVRIFGIDYERLGVEYYHGHFACESCGAPFGGKHHPGCTNEVCPMEECNRKIMECGHWNEVEMQLPSR